MRHPHGREPVNSPPTRRAERSDSDVSASWSMQRRHSLRWRGNVRLYSRTRYQLNVPLLSLFGDSIADLEICIPVFGQEVLVRRFHCGLSSAIRSQRKGKDSPTMSSYGLTAALNMMGCMILVESPHQRHSLMAIQGDSSCSAAGGGL